MKQYDTKRITKNIKLVYLKHNWLQNIYDMCTRTWWRQLGRRSL